jgi:hypothetical protein
LVISKLKTKNLDRCDKGRPRVPLSANERVNFDLTEPVGESFAVTIDGLAAGSRSLMAFQR